MKIVQYVLYLFALLFAVCGVFAVLPWPMINGFMQSLGGISFPDEAVAVYTLRSFMLIIFWIGVLIFLVARDPVAHGQTAHVLAGMFLTTAVLCLVLGLRYGLPGFFYFDVITSAILGLLLLAHARCGAVAMRSGKGGA